MSDQIVDLRVQIGPMTYMTADDFRRYFPGSAIIADLCRFAQRAGSGFRPCSPATAAHHSHHAAAPCALAPALTPAHGPGAHCLRSAISRARAPPAPNGAHCAPGSGSRHPRIRIPCAARLTARDPVPAVSAAPTTANLLDACTYCSRTLPTCARLVPRRRYTCKPGTGTASAVTRSDCNIMIPSQ
jgi:hypothetical protein